MLNLKYLPWSLRLIYYIKLANISSIASFKPVSVLAKKNKSSFSASKSCHRRLDTAQKSLLCCEREV